MDARKYTYRVLWSEDDHEHIGLCAEFPGLSWLAGSQQKALQGITELVAGVLTDLEANRESIPEPLSLRKFSGKFQVRVSPEVHRALAIRSAESGISIQRIVRDKLGEAC